MVKGWFVGNFEPSLYKTNEVEVAVKRYTVGDKEDAHFHKIATEFTLILNGTNGVSKEIISKIHTAYPDVSTDWLLYGEGEPFKKQARNPLSFFPENEIFRSDDENATKYGKDSGLKTDSNSRQTSDDKTKTGNTSTGNSDSQQRENKRRVVKIMIYYSDNTFETYSPDK